MVQYKNLTDKPAYVSQMIEEPNEVNICTPSVATYAG